MDGLERYGHGGDRWTAGERFGKEPDSFLDFSANINPLGPPPQAMEVLRQALSEPNPPVISRYPDPVCRGLTHQLARRLGVTPEEVLIGNGGAELIDSIHSVAAPRRVGVIHPSFAEYERAARKRGLEILPPENRLGKGISPGAGELLDWIREVDLAWVGHPNNPSGTLLSLEDLATAAEEAARRETVLAVDEAFLDFLPEPGEASLLPQLREFPTTILFRSMTKFYALPGLRLGYAVASKEWIGRLRRWQAPWSVNGPAQLVGEAALQDRKFGERTRAWLAAERPFLLEGLRILPQVEVLPGEVNYFLLRLELSTAGSESPSLWLQRELGERGIMIRDGSTYPGLDGRYVRVAVRSREENRRLLAALSEVLSSPGDSAVIRLVTGGVRSGKSRFAEELAGEMGKRILYVATGVVTDAEMAARVHRHRERRPREWGLAEEPLHLTRALTGGQERDGILVDCLSTWVANRLMQLPEKDWEERRNSFEREMEEEMERVLDLLSEEEAVLVTSETGLGGVAMTPLGRLFQDTLGSMNQQAARRAGEVWMVVSGVPWKVKG